MNGLVKGIKMLIESERDRCISISKYQHPIQRSFSLKNNTITPLKISSLNCRTQDMKTIIMMRQIFYIFKKECFNCSTNNIFSNDSAFVEIPKEYSLDIDNEEDWKFAEKICS